VPVKEDADDDWSKVTNALIKKYGEDKAKAITDYAQIGTDSAEELMKSHGLTHKGDGKDEERWFQKYPWLKQLANKSWMDRLINIAGEGPDYGMPNKESVAELDDKQRTASSLKYSADPRVAYFDKMMKRYGPKLMELIVDHSHIISNNKQKEEEKLKKYGETFTSFMDRFNHLDGVEEDFIYMLKVAVDKGEEGLIDFFYDRVEQAKKAGQFSKTSRIPDPDETDESVAESKTQITESKTKINKSKEDSAFNISGVDNEIDRIVHLAKYQ